MNTKMIRYILCRMLGVESVLLMIPVIVAALYQEMIVTVFSVRCKKAGAKSYLRKRRYGNRCTCMDFMVFVWRNAFYDIRLYTKLHGCVF